MPHTVVVGGGIAGLSVAWQLARGGDRRVTLLEREALLGTHSSARNAQIWLPIDDDATTGPLARRSAALLLSLLGEEPAWLRRSDALVLVSSEREAEGVERGALRGGTRARRLDPAERGARCPALPASLDDLALSIEGAGILDPHSMLRALAAAARHAGVDVRVSAGVRRVLTSDGAVTGVELDDGARLASDEVVLAGGAWAGGLGRTVGADVALVPLRRHLVILDADPRTAGTTVWRFNPVPVYWRPESGGVLASPCDEVADRPCLPASDPGALELLATALEGVAPSFVDAPVRTSWACLRTYAHDRELVLGPDPRVPGLAWMAGLGGRGMTVGVGAGELVAQAMRGRTGPLFEATRPDRPQPDALIAP